MPTTVATSIWFLLALGVGRSFAESFGQSYLLNLLAKEVLDALETVDISITYEGDGLTITIGTSCTTDTVNIILAVGWHRATISVATSTSV